jgi:hypothetical protein
MGKKSKKEVKTRFYYFLNYIFQMSNTYFQEKAASKTRMKRKLSGELKEKKKPKKKEILADIVTSKKKCWKLQKRNQMKKVNFLLSFDVICSIFKSL